MVGRYRHIVMHEAKDLEIVDREIVRRLLATGGSWTIVGDMSRPPSEHTANPWNEIVNLLGTRSGLHSPLREIRTVYRSTNEILVLAMPHCCMSLNRQARHEMDPSLPFFGFDR